MLCPTCTFERAERRSMLREAVSGTLTCDSCGQEVSGPLAYLRAFVDDHAAGACQMRSSAP